MLNSTYFKFNKFLNRNLEHLWNLIYHQLYAVMQDLEECVLSSFNFDVSFYYRFVDNIIMAILSDKVQEVLSKFNSYYNTIQFTCEIDNNRINFLNTTIIVENNIIKFDLYYKSTFSGRYLNYHSQHPPSHKKGTIFEIVDIVTIYTIYNINFTLRFSLKIRFQ